MSEERPSEPASVPSSPPQGDGSSKLNTQNSTLKTLFLRSRDPIFLLNRQRRILFVNGAWEDLTGITAAEARGLACLRRVPAVPSATDSITRALCPPPEVQHGEPVRVRRTIHSNSNAVSAWNIDFFPVCDERGSLRIFGKIAVVSHTPPVATIPLPERLGALRDTMTRRFRLERLGDGTPTQELLAEQVRLASQSRTNVLLLGEPGTGKQWLARTIHYQSTARDLAFAVVDCRRLPPAALQAVLLGESGLLNRADIGAVYFREPALLPRDVQVRLCEVLADPSPRLPRLLAGTSIDLAEEVRANRLVEEWRCALGVLAIEVPPLRKRLAELPWFVEQFLERIGSSPAREPAPGDELRLPTLTPDAWDCLRSYPWPGNLRELFRVLASAHYPGVGDRIDLADLPGYVRTAVRLDQTPGPDAEPSLPLPQLLEQVERRLIQIALQRTRGNKSRAAELLSLPRPRLLRRMAALGIQEP